jgi:hypothetical protein
MESNKEKNGIIIYGTGLEGEKFYSKFRNELHFVGAVDRVKRNFHDLKLYNIDELVELSKLYYIVVATGEKFYIEIKETLGSVGLVEFRDYIWNGEYNKKIILIYGNCHFVPIVSYMKMQMDICCNYRVRYFRIGSSDDRQYPSECELRNCDIFITQDIRENNTRNLPGYKTLLNKIDLKKTKIVIVPNLYGCNLFFPQYAKDDVNKSVFYLNYSKRNVNISPEQMDIIEGLCSIHDQNIDLLFSKGCDLNSLEEYVQSKDVYSKEEIVSNFEDELCKIKKREEQCSISISDYIEDKYKDFQLFYEPDHPTNHLLIELSKRIMRYLKIGIDYEYDNSIDELDSREIFIYKCVSEALNLKYRQVFIRKKHTHSTLGNCPLTMKEYIKEYIQCIYGDIDR